MPICPNEHAHNTHIHKQPLPSPLLDGAGTAHNTLNNLEHQPPIHPPTLHATPACPNIANSSISASLHYIDIADFDLSSRLATLQCVN